MWKLLSFENILCVVSSCVWYWSCNRCIKLVFEQYPTNYMTCSWSKILIFFVKYQPTNANWKQKSISMTFNTEHLIISFCCTALWAFDILVSIKLAHFCSIDMSPLNKQNLEWITEDSLKKLNTWKIAETFFLYDLFIA